MAKIIGRLVKNKAEQAFQLEALKNGWSVRKRGWPDFFCTKGNEVICVEVKPRSSEQLKRDQRVIMGFLAKAGIRCYKWTPDGKLEKISGEQL